MINFFKKIENYAEKLPELSLDQSYFQALTHLLNVHDDDNSACNGGWPWQVIWQDKCVSRKGFLLFETCENIPAVTPENDFFIYFLPPFCKKQYCGNNGINNVFFQLVKLDKNIKKLLAIYRASHELSLATEGNAKRFYIAQYWESLSDINQWIQQYKLTAFTMTHQGLTKPIAEWANLMSANRLNLNNNDFNELVNMASSVALEPYFRKMAPEYPKFQVLVKNCNRERLIKNTIKTLCHSMLDKKMPVHEILDAIVILDSLELINDDCVEIKKSKYVDLLLDACNASRLISRYDLLNSCSGEYFTRGGCCLELDLFVILLFVMACSGYIEIIVNNNKINFIDVNLLSGIPLHVIKQFSHVKRLDSPRIKHYQSLFKLIDIPSSLNSSEYLS